MKHTLKAKRRRARRQVRREAARLRCMSDQRFALGRWFRMEDEADAYRTARQRQFLGFITTGE